MKNQELVPTWEPTEVIPIIFGDENIGEFGYTLATNKFRHGFLRRFATIKQVSGYTCVQVQRPGASLLAISHHLPRDFIGHLGLGLVSLGLMKLMELLQTCSRLRHSVWIECSLRIANVSANTTSD